MTQFDQRTEWYEFNQETIDALISDGSEADATYTIEHHMACNNFDRLEKAALDAFKAGFEVTDAEEVYLDDGGTVFCFDVIAERPLKRPELDTDIDTLLKIADKHQVHYDGWGTYFIGDEEEIEQDD